MKYRKTQSKLVNISTGQTTNTYFILGCLTIDIVKLFFEPSAHEKKSAFILTLSNTSITTVYIQYIIFIFAFKFPLK